MRALDRKLLRDLWRIKAQAVAIALIIGAGVTMYCMYLSTFDSLAEMQRTYYARYRFADVFASLERAPLRLRERIAALPGVAAVETRVVVEVVLDVPDLPEPAQGRLVSLAEPGRTALNELFLRRGRLPEPDRADQVVVHEAFALAHRLQPGDSITALVNGRRRALSIVGVALSPEYVYTIRPGDLMPDDRRYAVMWMDRRSLAAAFDLEGGFNDLALALAPGASPDAVIAGLDDLLAPYGGLGAIPRALQSSHWFIANELRELETFGSIVPVIFLAVAAFLLHVVLSRIVAMQRTQIAALKALGYPDRTIARHYVQLGLAIAALGVLLGTGAGAWLGAGMTRMYNDYFRFPVFAYALAPRVVLASAAVGLIAAAAGAVSAVRQAVRLPPAEAMHPQPPPRFGPSAIERIGVGRVRLGRLLGPAGRMVVRGMARRPLRTVLSVIGVGCAVAMLVVGSFFLDSIEWLMHVEFEVARRHDVAIAFVAPRAPAALHAVERLPGVLTVEPFRMLPARLVAGPRSRRVALRGRTPDARLDRLVDAAGKALVLPPEGLVLSSKLAEVLAVGIGAPVRIEVLEGARPVRTLPVAAIVDVSMGLMASLPEPALHRLMREDRLLSGAFLAVDPSAIDALYHRLKVLPRVAGVALTRAALDSFRQTLAETFWLMIAFNVGFASVIAVGVVYNSARVALSERERDLASLRVLGFTRAEISAILLGELAAVTLLAIPFGLALGYGLAVATLAGFDNELFRPPLVVEPSTYGWAAITVLLASAVSALVVRQRLDRLDLVAVLKTRE